MPTYTCNTNSGQRKGEGGCEADIVSSPVEIFGKTSVIPVEKFSAGHITSLCGFSKYQADT
jgi:hypothetical protein